MAFSISKQGIKSDRQANACHKLSTITNITLHTNCHKISLLVECRLAIFPGGGVGSGGG